MTIGFDYRVVGNASKPFMPECLSVKVSWIVIVATDEKEPVVGFIYSLGIAPKPQSPATMTRVSFI